ncbi:hypothetical protein ES703_17960 [subsurface metagenome]
MFGVFLKPRISAFTVDRIENLRDMLKEDEEDIREGLKALVDEEGTITWEQYQHQRAEREPQRELPD